MIRKSLKITIEITALTSILSMLAVITCFIWIMIAPRSLSFIKPYLEKELSSLSPDFSVKIEDSFIQWDKKQHSISVHARNIDFINETSDKVASLPEISFGFSLIRLLKGKLFSSDLTIMRPNIHINTAEKTLYVSEESGISLKEAALSTIFGTLGNAGIFNLNSIRVQDVNIFVNNGLSDMLWKIDEGYAKLETIKKTTQIKSEFKINFGKDVSYFAVNIKKAQETIIDNEIIFQELPSYVFAELFPNHHIEQKINMVFSGKSNLLISDDGAISQTKIILEKSSGHIDLPELFSDTIEIKNLTIDADLYNGLSDFAINNMSVDLHGPTVKISGNIHNTKQWPEFLPSLDIKASVENVEVDDVASYWPYPLDRAVREWVTQNITEGMVTHAEGHFKFEARDIENILEREKSGIFSDTPPIPDDAIDATVHVEKAKVSYMENYPAATDVKAIVKFTGHSLRASAQSAKMLSTNISNAQINFDNLWQHPLTISIKGDFSGPAQDGIAFMKVAYKQKPDSAELTSIYNVSGDATGTAEITIPFKNDLKYDDMDLKISSNVKNALLPGIIKGKNFAAASIDFSLDKYDVTVKGDSLLNNIPAKIEVHKSLSDASAASDIEFKFKGNLSPTEIKELTGVEIPYVSGKAGIDINVVNKNNIATISGSADLLQNAISISNLSFTKDAGKSGNITFNIIKNEKSDIEIKDFKSQGDGFNISGSAKIDGTQQAISELALTSVKFGNTDISANYKSSNIGKNIEINGKGIDLSNTKFSELFRKDPAQKETPLNLNAKLARVVMKNGEILNDVTASLNCSAEKCISGSLYGKMRSENFVVLSLKNIGDRSALLGESDNAGAVISALNISKNITGGHLNIDSTLGKRGSGTVALGVVKISNFTAIKTPLLGKILTLASFRGFEDLLNNQGISFKKFEAPFTMSGGVITVKDAKSSGASIGITTAGTIDTNKDEIDLKGVIVPAYAVNNIIGKIPFVGKIIIGNDGEGILATKYSVTGTYDDTKISVNPLSILTPGFLRNLFDIFD